MARVLVIYTGGTFGGIETPDGVAPSDTETLAARLLQVEGQVEVQVVGFGRVLDSSSIVPDDWSSMVAQIRDSWDDFDGFVIIHGTDSMAYTSSALSWMMRGLSKPVVLTGSQVPLSFAKNDAAENYTDAVAFAADASHSGVWIVFGGAQVPGHGAVKVSCEDWRAFDSPKGTVEPLANDDVPLSFQTVVEPDVRLVYCHPGMSAQQLVGEILAPVKGLVIAAYGVGNLPVDPAIEPALEQAISEQGKRIIQVTQCAHGAVDAGFYAAGSGMVRAGVEPGGNLTIEAALTKLMVELGA